MQIAIDGPSGSGKSSVAKNLAKRLGLVHIDTGAMYRAVAMAAKLADVEWSDEKAIYKLIETSEINIQYRDGTQRIFLDGKDVTENVRSAEMGVGASKVSAFGGVREKLVAMQQDMAKKVNVVMDGRDIGIKVLPNADVKIFLTADVAVRARRRCGELENLGLTWSFEEISEQIRQRDHEDSNRTISPLIKADDAIEVDASNLDIDGVVDKIERIINERGV